MGVKLEVPKFKMPDMTKLKMPSFSLKGFKFPPAFPVMQKSILAIEFGEQWVKMAAASEKGKEGRQITWAAWEPSQDVDQFSLAMKIAQRVKAQHLKPSKILISFPSRQLTTRILSLPSTDPAEIQDIVDLQAVKQTPYSREEITSGYHTIGSDDAGYSRIFLAISHRDQSSQYFRTAEMAFLLPDQIVPSVEGLRFWTGMATDNPDVELVLDLDEMSTELLVTKGGSLVFTRSIAIGAKQILEQGAGMEGEFLREVQRSIETSDEMKSHQVGHITLTGVQDAAKNVAALLSREMNLACEVMTAFAPFGSKASAQLSDDIAKSPVSFSALAGLLLSADLSSINLMPQDVRLRKGLEERAKELAFMGTLLLTIVMLGSLIGFEKIYKRNVYLDYLKKEYAAIQGQAEDVERVIGKIKLADEQSGGQGSFLEVLNDVNSVLSDSLIVTSIEYNGKEKNVILRGTAQEMSSVFQFLSTLEAMPALEQVKTRNVTKRKSGETEISEFEISAVLPGGAKEEKVP